MASKTALAPCGTASACKRHISRGEPVDPECREAGRLATQAYRRSKGIKPKRVREVYRPPVVEVGPACAHPDVNPDWFFSVDEFDRPDLTARERKNLTTQGYRKARKVCAGCPLRAECLRENLDAEYGIFGGLGPWQRDQLRLSDTRVAEPNSFFEGNVTS